jgi:hypothetical protein
MEETVEMTMLYTNWEQAQQDFIARSAFETRLKAMQRDDALKADNYVKAHIDALHVLLGTLDQYEKHLLSDFREYPYAYSAMIQVIGNTNRQFQMLMRLLGPIDEEVITNCLNTIATDRPLELINGIDHFNDVFLGSLFAERQQRASKQTIADWDNAKVEEE